MSGASINFGGKIFAIGAIVVAAFVAAKIVVMAPELFNAPLAMAEAQFGDVDGYVRAGELALDGRAADAYDQKIYSEKFGDGHKGLHWFHPPHAFLFSAPLAMVPFVAVRPLWVALTLASMVGIALVAGLRRRATLLMFVLSPATLAVVYFLQVSAFIALGLTTALLIAPRRPIAAGIILALLTMKPQYGLLAPVLLAATGQWRAIVYSCLATAALIVASAKAFGLETWRVFFASLDAAKESYLGLAYPATVSIGQAALKLGGSVDLASAAQWAFILAAAGIVALAGRRRDYRTAVALTLLFALAASPSAWPHDWPLVAASVAIFASTRCEWPPTIQALALIAWATPIISLFDVSRSAPTIILYGFAAAMAAWALGVVAPKPDTAAA